LTILFPKKIHFSCDFSYYFCPVEARLAVILLIIKYIQKRKKMSENELFFRLVRKKQAKFALEKRQRPLQDMDFRGDFAANARYSGDRILQSLPPELTRCRGIGLSPAGRSAEVMAGVGR
jgi:hypothetical protein